MNLNFLLSGFSWVRRKLSRREANSAFPLASALPSLTFCFLTATPVCDLIDRLQMCVHVCVRERILCCLRCECSGSRLGCVKGCWWSLGRGAVEAFCDNPLEPGGGRKSVYLERLEESGYAAQSTTLDTHSEDFLCSNVKY